MCDECREVEGGGGRGEGGGPGELYAGEPVATTQWLCQNLN